MTAPIHIRQTTAADQAALNQLFGDSYPVLLAPDYPAERLDQALPLITRANPALLTSGSYFVAVTGDGPPLAAGGWTAASPHRPEPLGTGHIRHVVTHPQATRRGLAAAILRSCFDQARTAGMQRLVALSTRTAVPFYSAMGFKRDCDEIIQMSPEVSFPAVRMQRVL